METLTDAVRLAFEKAVPSKVSASWGHANGLDIVGWDKRHNEEYVTMMPATIISGAGATPHQDGWHARGPECCFGALTSGDIELLEYSYPIIIRRYSLMTNSGGADMYRGGSRTAWEVEPLSDDITFIMFGEGRRIPALGAAGAESQLIDAKVGRLEWKKDGKTRTIRDNIMDVIKPGETVTNMNPGGIEKPEGAPTARGKGADNALKGTRKAIVTPDGKRQRVPVYDDAKLGAGDTIKGPAIIEEVTTTIVIEPQWAATLDESGSYVIAYKARR
jgi:N-methylhydantoinase B